MEQNSVEVVLLPITTAAATAQGADIVIPGGFSGLNVYVNCTARSGTSPTLDVKVQEIITAAGSSDLAGKQPTGAAQYSDFIAFTQITATGAQIARFSGYNYGAATGAAANNIYAVVSGSQSATTMKAGPVPRKLRISYVIGGTNPSFTFYIVGQLMC